MSSNLIEKVRVILSAWGEPGVTYYHLQENSETYDRTIRILKTRDDVTIYDVSCDCDGGRRDHKHVLLSCTASWEALRRYISRRSWGERRQSSMKRITCKMHWLNSILYVMGSETTRKHKGHHFNQRPRGINGVQKALIRGTLEMNDVELARDRAVEHMNSSVRRAVGERRLYERARCQ